MDLNTASELYNELREDKLSFFYQGMFSDMITTELVDLSEQNVSNIEDLSKLRKKVNYLMVECLQNIDRHGKEGIEEVKVPGFFFLRNIGGSLFITSANMIPSEEVPDLRSKLDQVNDLDPDGLKEMYLSILKKGEISERGGAGLGLIEMARKTGEKIEYAFFDHSESWSQFYMQLKLTRKDVDGSSNVLSIDEGRAIHQKLRDSGCMLAYTGDFSHESIKPIINTLERNIKNKEGAEKKLKKIYHLMVELLQNISRYGEKPEDMSQGFFALCEDETTFSICAGNLIDNSSRGELETQLNDLDGKSREELLEMYKEAIMAEDDEDKIGAGLGLIDIARYASQPLQYDFQKMNDKFDLYLINVIV